MKIFPTINFPWPKENRHKSIAQWTHMSLAQSTYKGLIYVHCAVRGLKPIILHIHTNMICLLTNLKCY